MLKTLMMLQLWFPYTYLTRPVSTIFTLMTGILQSLGQLITYRNIPTREARASRK